MVALWEFLLDPGCQHVRQLGEVVERRDELFLQCCEALVGIHNDLLVVDDISPGVAVLDGVEKVLPLIR